MNREVLQQAFDALNLINHRGNTDDELLIVGRAMTDIKERLAKPESEPVAYKLEHSDGSHVGYLSASNYQLQKTDISESEIISIPLYTYPPDMNRLSDDELDELHFQNPDDPFAFAMAVQNALLEKNK